MFPRLILLLAIASAGCATYHPDCSVPVGQPAARLDSVLFITFVEVR